MGLMGGLFKALGFESDTKPKTVKKKKAKASFSLKGTKKSRVDQIDGVPVYYPENTHQVKDFISFVKEGKAVIISCESLAKEDTEKITTYLQGFVFGANAKFIDLNDEKLYLILPEGMEVEE